MSKLDRFSVLGQFLQRSKRWNGLWEYANTSILFFWGAGIVFGGAIDVVEEDRSEWFIGITV